MKLCANARWGTPLDVIYCDNHLLVAVKPGGVATQPDFHEVARAYIKERFNKPGNVFLEPIHRLDKPVSGLVIFARTSKALSRLNEAQREHKIQKFYRARVEGAPEKQATLNHRLLHGDHRALIDPKGKEAILHYTRIGPHEIEIELVTGRYHQIRAQLGAVGLPIVGDRKYGSRKESATIALTHVRTSLPHPTTKEQMTFSVDAIET